jgi:hypothetical protein
MEWAWYGMGLMEDDSGDAAESLLPYDQWMEDSLRYVVVRALNHAATEGLPGKHHFYITFRTDYPGVVIPARLLEKYPHEMTIVLQHQFRDLVADELTRILGVTLSFGGVSATLTVPLDAVSAFADPSIQYGLRFTVKMPEQPTPAPVVEPPEPAPDSTPQVVSLDAFRKRRE